jgi:hypothetical protein
MCQMADLAEMLRADVKDRGLTYECRSRWYANPSLAALFEVEKQITAGMTAFGMTPASRGKLGVAEPQPASKFELLQMRRATGHGGSASCVRRRVLSKDSGMGGSSHEEPPRDIASALMLAGPKVRDTRRSDAPAASASTTCNEDAFRSLGTRTGNGWD